MNQYVNKVTVIVAIVSVLVGRYVLTPKQKTKEVIKVVTVEKQRIDTKKNIFIREVKKKDGTTVKETTEIENTVVDTTKNSKTESSKTSETGSKITLGVLAIVDTSQFNKPEYGITVAAPLIGNLNVQGIVTTDRKVGVGLSIGF